MVTYSIPANTDIDVLVNSDMAAIFSEAMNPLTITTVTFTLTQGGTPVSGAVSYVGFTATFDPDSDLAAGTTYTAMITTGAKDLAGNPLTSNYAWNFTTAGSGGGGGGGGGGVVVDTTRPTVISTVPINASSGAGITSDITATFSEAMRVSTITTVTFTLKQGATTVPGAVTCLGSTATFNPTDALSISTEYVATITTGVTDLAGNALEENYSWSFTTGAAPDTTPPTVISTVPSNNPVNASTNVDINNDITATFSEAMNPLTITTVTFTLKQGGTPVPGAVTCLGSTATFNPTDALALDTEYTATITTGVTDTAGNPMAAIYSWRFTTAGEILAPGAVPLGSASTFGIAARSSITETGGSFITGDVALTPGTVCELLPGQVSGTIYINDLPVAGVAQGVFDDLLDAYNWAWLQATAVTMIPGADQGASYPYDPVLLTGGMAPGVYWSESTMLINTPLVLNAGGNADAVWIFKIGSSLTTYVGGTPLTGGNVVLANGAQAKNVFFVPVMDATIGVDTTFNGNILAGRTVVGETRAVINGRLLGGANGAGSLTLDTNTVNVP
jgi:hypothetical protein